MFACLALLGMCTFLPFARAATTLGNSISVGGTLTVTGLLTANGGIATTGSLGLGSASTTDLTITTDGTGDGEVVLPTGAIGSAEILDGSIVNDDLTSGTFGNVTGTGTLTAGATGAGFTLAFGSSTLSGTVPVANGGTATSTAPSSGQLLIGKSDGTYAVTGLTAGSGITITPGNGTITIANGAATPPFTDTTAIAKGSTDDSKQIRFEVDGLTTSTTRVLTVPDADLTVVGTDTAQTLTNKTIAAGSNTISGITDANLSAGTFGNVTGTGTLTAGATGAGFTLAFGSSTLSGTVPVANGGTGASTAASARANLGAPTVYEDQTIKSSAKIWTSSATTTSGVATFYPTDDGTGSGNAIFTNVYSVQATPATDTSTAIDVPFASVKQVAADKTSITVNVLVGQNITVGGDTTAFAPDSTTVYVTVIGD